MIGGLKTAESSDESRDDESGLFEDYGRWTKDVHGVCMKYRNFIVSLSAVYTPSLFRLAAVFFFRFSSFSFFFSIAFAVQ